MDGKRFAEICINSPQIFDIIENIKDLTAASAIAAGHRIYGGRPDWVSYQDRANLEAEKIKQLLNNKKEAKEIISTAKTFAITNIALTQVERIAQKYGFQTDFK
jgi:hypothetical protein